ncbi:carbon-nitrogen hydrolase [Hirsutella rhossiliensis]|uniref:Carbon-nitrogen hydrolase domain-containing protein n=1 Tax=Hirsutella rhossiliensis TaxID=111463 RepID=A0A9P8N448_9HYPO|nr:carbon-nitrogen hydrolase domain-containing protein [Hirsutella rhossiliensis]KAH0966247.1 carbon-nitrogen hydrolase domain-containing protein [Hirsutella rhossiliensis]
MSTTAAASIRIGTASPATGPTTSATLAQLGALARRAAGHGIDLLVLPEAYLGGYPRGASFGCVVGERTAQGRDEFARYFDAAVDLGDTVGDGAGAGARWLRRELGDHDTVRGDGTREALEAIAGDTGVFLVAGCIEKAGGSLYCAAVYVCPREGVVGKRRKVMPTGTERLVWAQGCPSTLRAVSTTIRGTRVNLAAALCWESYMPLLRQSLYAQNINLYLAPTADGRDAWLGLMRTIGVEGRCFVVSSNMCVRRDARPAALPSTTSPRPKHRRKSVVFDDDGNEIVLCRQEDDDDSAVDARPSPHDFVSRGGSCIVSPFGDVLAGPQWEDDDGLIYADVDMRDCIRGRLDIDTAGSYSRNDAFKLTVQGLDMDPLPY